MPASVAAMCGGAGCRWSRPHRGVELRCRRGDWRWSPGAKRMCGIVGYIGRLQAVEFLIEGLHRLEYRGYDSSGVVTIDDGGQFSITKTAGRVAGLAKKLKKAP